MSDSDSLAVDLERVAKILREKGPEALRRMEEWTTSGRMPSQWTPPQPGDEDYEGPEVPWSESISSQDAEDAEADAAAARYFGEFRALTELLTSKLRRVEALVGLATPAKPDRLGKASMMAAQVAADGWCASCWRNEQTLVPITMRKDRHGALKPRYKDLCQNCGERKGAHGELPPLGILKIRHSGRPLNTADVERHTGKKVSA